MKFTFKQFSVEQSGAAMKVGTDGVLLGAWANISNAKRILDIGTGTGLIALMLAQRNATAKIDAIDIDNDACRQAEENIKNSPWKERINAINKSLQTFAATENIERYDLIVSNPPYFIASLQSPEIRRTAARHTFLLPQDDLLAGIAKLLAFDGRFAAIFPYVEGNVFIAKASSQGLYCNKKLNVKPDAQKNVKRLLLEFSRQKQKFDEQTICIDTGVRGDYTNEYKKLTADFYLKF